MASGAAPEKPVLSLVAAIDENRLLAVGNKIPWHLPRDVAFYRAYTLKKWLLVGRRTYGQMRGWFKAGHFPLVLTHNPSWQPELGRAVASVEEALQLAAQAEQSELACCGGEKVYEAALPLADLLVLTLLTLIDHKFPAGEGAIYFPLWQPEDWKEESRIRHDRDAENPYAMTMVVLRRKGGMK
jgi:dihydrofolate reductase